LTALDGNGELPQNSSFPKGSVLVKEVYRNSALIGLAVMKKAPTDASAGDGWLWAEYGLDGLPGASITTKGSGCISCHNDTPNRDLVRTFDLH
jgi:Cytochrome P460